MFEWNYMAIMMSDNGIVAFGQARGRYHSDRHGGLSLH